VNDNKKQKDNKNNQLPEENQKVTIMPTMIDDSEEREEKRRDLSAIIPKFEEITENNNAIELTSRENTLKSDGATVIALIDAEGEAKMTANPSFPLQIDIEERKKEMQRKKSNKNKKDKPKKNIKAAQKFQNNMALISLSLIIFLAGFYYWYKKHPTEKDFTPLQVKVELGEKLPIRTSSYVKPGQGKVDELLYGLDLSNVILEEPGEYDFTVTYKGVSKTGKVIIEDSTPPELEVRNVTITEGTAYDASSFVESCKDPSGCNYAFQDNETPKKYTNNGTYVVYVVATDAFQNSVTKRANLIIEAEGNVKKYIRKTNFDFNTGYETKETYDLHFTEYSTYSLLINGTQEIVYYYQKEEKYQEARKEYTGEANYSFDDSKMTITYKKAVTTVGSNYSRLDDIDNYLKREGFTLEG